MDNGRKIIMPIRRQKVMVQTSKVVLTKIKRRSASSNGRIFLTLHPRNSDTGGTVVTVIDGGDRAGRSSAAIQPQRLDQQSLAEAEAAPGAYAETVNSFE